MFWGKKEDKRGLPELPPLKPSFLTDLQKKNQIEEQEKEDTLPEVPVTKDEIIKETPEELPELPSRFTISKISEKISIPSRKLMPETPKSKIEDVYVKIDRFHSARRALNSARNKLDEIEDLMKKIRETKMREEQELSSWEEEIESVKSKIEDVTKNIFEKTD